MQDGAVFIISLAMLNRGKNIRLFTHPQLEWLSHVHPSVPGILFLPVIGYFLTAALLRGVAWYAVGAMVLLGVVTWTLTEYILHRVVFHYVPHGDWQQRVFYIMHGIHHDDPTDATRLVMPPIVSIPLAIFFYSLFWLCMGREAGAIFFSGFVLGYLVYDYTHFFIHHGRPTSQWGKLVRRHHLLHHHAHDGMNFGVSSPFWDHIFGTFERRPVSNQRQQRAS